MNPPWFAAFLSAQPCWDTLFFGPSQASVVQGNSKRGVSLDSLENKNALNRQLVGGKGRDSKHPCIQQAHHDGSQTSREVSAMDPPQKATDGSSLPHLRMDFDDLVLLSLSFGGESALFASLI